MSSRKFPVVKGRVIRGTRVDSCGRPVYGDASQVASDGYISIAVTANYDDGDEIEQKNAWGRRCVKRDAEPELLNESLDVTFCAVDPEFYTLLTGMPVIYDAATGDAIGYDVDVSVRPSDVRVALENWSSAESAVQCDPDDEGLPWAYFLWPFLSGGKIGDYTIENGAVTFSATGLLTKSGSLWDLGPYLVTRDELGDPDFLQEPITATTHRRTFYTTVQPPAETDGLVPLDDPDVGEATGADAGSPGAFTPTNAVRPYDLVELQASAVVADPVTLWTTGQYVVLGNGLHAHWDGDTWEDGKAP